MKFTHIHSSSLHTRSAGNLEATTDRYYQHCSLLTLTEVRHDGRVRAVAEKGWGTVGTAADSDGQTDCMVAFDLSVWSKLWVKQTRLYAGRYKLANGKTAIPIFAATAMLKHKTSGHKLLISAGHMPPTVGGANNWVSIGAAWAGRRKAYKDGVKTWNSFVTQQIRTQRPDMVLVTADWNLGFQRKWVRDYMRNSWKSSGLAIGWKSYSGPGTFGGRFIDATLYRGMTTEGSKLIADDSSSDHRPYKDVFEVKTKPGTPIKVNTPEPGEPAPTPTPDPTPGTNYFGEEWWGFGDFDDDEIYHIPEFQT
jgi:hypothetical protein